ncbi:MAG: T9SS type A sorting domain-containing protein [Flavobacteriales bacterium]|nr:T9SS type A sorting domain-containing protein [Flavobacteriales bacterium]
MHVFRLEAEEWAQVGSDLNGIAELDQFGWSVRLDANGDRIIVGAPYHEGPFFESGQARVFEFDGADWNQIGQAIDGTGEEEQFGYDVAISDDGSIISVSSIRAYFLRGTVRSYQLIGGVWTQLGSDLIGQSTSDAMGESIDMVADGSRIVVGITGEDQGTMNAGKIRVYDFHGVDWNQVGSNINGENSFDAFGRGVDISADGSTIAAGAPNQFNSQSNARQAKVFSWDGNAWVQKGATIEGNDFSELLGYDGSLNAGGSVWAVASINHDSPSAQGAGRLQLLQWDGAAWQSELDLVGDNPGVNMGSDVQISQDGRTFMVGVRGSDIGINQSGKAEVWLDAICLGDFDDNGTRDTSDLLLFLSQLNCTSKCIADLNGDGEVTIIGINTDFPANESGLWAGIGQTSSTAWEIQDIQQVSATELNGTLSIPVEAISGPYNVYLSGTWQGMVLDDGCFVVCPEDPGCNDPDACNFDSGAACNDGSCTYPGCTDPNGCNYDPDAGCEDGSCTYPGCSWSNAENYDPDAGCDDGTCTYTLSGMVWYDENENGIISGGEYGLPFQEVILSPGNILAITNDAGEYQFTGVQAGQYTLEVVNTDLYPYTSTQNPVNVNLNNGGFNTTYNFGLSEELPQYAICVDYYPPGAGYPCNDWVNHNICYRNMGNVPIDGYIAVEMNPLFQDYQEVTPIDSVVDLTIYMGFEGLQPGQMFFYDVKFLTPSVDYIGEFITSNATAVGFNNGEQVAIGVEELTVEMTCAYDPNDKQVFPNGYEEPHYVLPETELEYLVRFQNTGNAPATNVTISDTISEYLDLETFELMANSHSVMVQIDPNTRIVDFVFENIMLPDSFCCEPESHGLVSYIIRPYADLAPETEINNTAYIFFDNNPPIVTNTTWTTIYDCNNGLATFEMSTEESCSGEEIDFLNEQNYVEEYSWLIDGESVGVDDLISLDLDPGEYEIEHIAMNPLCEATQSDSFIVNPSPEAEAGDDQAICFGEAIDLTASGGFMYDWGDLGQGATQTVEPEETTTYVVTVISEEGCSDTDEVEVMVNPLPVANAGMDQAICEGETANLMASGGESYEWEDLGSGANQDVTPDETTVYVVTVEDANGCSDSDEVEVAVNPLPTAEITENGPELTASAGESYQWYINGTPIDGATDQSYTAETTGNYSVEVTNIYGCSTISEEVDVIIISVEEQEVAILTYPDPTHDILYIQVEAGWTYEMSLFDASGRLVAQQSNIVDSLFELDCTQFGTGTYKLALRNGDQRITKTIIVK